MLTQYPWWFAIIGALLALAATWFLYRNNPIGVEGKRAKLLLWLLHAFRFSVLFVLMVLLLGPLVRLITTQTQKPVIIFAIDNTQSVTLGNDSLQLKQALNNQFELLQKELGNDYDVVPYLVGKESKQASLPNFKDKETNLNQLFLTLKNTYDGVNLGAVVLASDGLYNKGENPLQAASELKAPVFTIGLGDTVQRKDVLIKNVRTNQLVFKGNSFPLQIDIAAFAAIGETTQITITQNGRITFKKQLTLSNNYFNTLLTNLTANEVGSQHIIIEASVINKEVSTVNNRMEMFINVIDGKQKIALLAYTPHPDVAAIEKTLNQQENYTTNTFIISQQQTPNNLAQYSMVIAHQLPGNNGEGTVLLKQLKEINIPILFVIGAQTNLGYLNQLEPTIQVGGTRMGNMNEVTPIYNNNFSLFTLSIEEQEHLKKFPPVMAPFGNYKINGEVEVLFKQQIGYVKTEYPLAFFAKGSTSKSGFFCAEGFWKWRMYDYAISQQKTSSTILSGMVQYLTSKKDQSRFRVNSKKEIEENESVEFNAELYNESYQLINTPEVSMVLKNNKGKNYTFTFNKTNNTYTLNAGLLPTGTYDFEATATVGTQPQKAKGQFIVKPLQMEFAQTTANHQLLNELATQQGGEMYQLNSMNKITDAIQKNERIKPIIYQNQDVKSWIDLKWIFVMLMMLLTIEWFVRKWNGSI